MRENDRERERAKESKGAAMKSVIRKLRIDLSISFFGTPRWISVDVSRKNPTFFVAHSRYVLRIFINYIKIPALIWANPGKGFQ